MIINFVLWGTGKGGGLRVLMEVAYGLAKRGHKINMIALNEPHYWFKIHKNMKLIYLEKKSLIWVPFFGKRSVSFLINKILNLVKYPYELNRIQYLSENIPPADATIATFYPTAYSTMIGGKGNLFYYIQHNEELWSLEKSTELAKSTYFLPLKPIVVSKWLKDFVYETTGNESIHVGNAVDQSTFKPSANKNKKLLLGFIRGLDWKGDKELLEAFKIIQKEIPNIGFRIIGRMKNIKKAFRDSEIKLNNLELISPIENDLKLARLYSESYLLLYAAHLEGYGLPPLEAMACGTPSVIADSGGINDFAKDNFNCLIVPIKSSEKLAKSAIKLLNDENLYHKLRDQSLITGKKFTWEKVVNKVEKALKEK